ncbi:hypothetical protein ACFPOA_01110 [Lysobacter niabensis]
MISRPLSPAAKAAKGGRSTSWWYCRGLMWGLLAGSVLVFFFDNRD